MTLESAIPLIFNLAVLVMSVIIHEVSHGFAANALGDPTAKNAGRLTLNPIPHIDPFGSIILPSLSILIGGMFIGWAKPVPYNPMFLRVQNKDLGSAIVGAAGPLANIAIAVFFALAVRFASFWAGPLGASAGAALELMVAIAVINLWLAAFNLIPVPPLDGSKVLFYLLPFAYATRMFLEQYGFFILLFLVFIARTPLILLGNAVEAILRFIIGVG